MKCQWFIDLFCHYTTLFYFETCRKRGKEKVKGEITAMQGKKINKKIVHQNTDVFLTNNILFYVTWVDPFKVDFSFKRVYIKNPKFRFLDFVHTLSLKSLSGLSSICYKTRPLIFEAK